MLPLYLAALLTTSLNPDEALKRLVEGNTRYVQEKGTCPDRVQERRAAVVAQQNPFAVIVGCSDSRVAPELLFDQGIGDLFVVRIAGNVIGNTEMESTAYGVDELGCTLVMVLGHANCGAVKAVLSGETDEIPTISAAIKKGGSHSDSLDQFIKNNARASAQVLRDSPQLKNTIATGKLKVVAAYYNLTTGSVELLQD